MPELILASTSSYRRALLERLGLPFRGVAPNVDERALERPEWSPAEIAERLANMPSMGFLDTLGYILLQLVITIVAALTTVLMVFLLIGYGIPYFLFGSF